MPSLDLDAFLEEQNQDPYVVTLGGKDYIVPSDIPWPALQKYSNLSEKDINAELISDMLSLIFGKDQYAKMQEAGLNSGSMAEMKLFTGVMSHIGESMMGEEAMGKMLAGTTNPTNGTKPRKAKRSA